ncbi:MAG: hypothetical protein ABIJ08_06910 [Nanoarchaeota archaeon]
MIELKDITWIRIIELIIALIILTFLILKLFIFKDNIDISPLVPAVTNIR